MNGGPTAGGRTQDQYSKKVSASSMKSGSKSQPNNSTRKPANSNNSGKMGGYKKGYDY